MIDEFAIFQSIQRGLGRGEDRVVNRKTRCPFGKFAISSVVGFGGVPSSMCVSQLLRPIFDRLSPELSQPVIFFLAVHSIIPFRPTPKRTIPSLNHTPPDKLPSIHTLPHQSTIKPIPTRPRNLLFPDQNLVHLCVLHQTLMTARVQVVCQHPGPPLCAGTAKGPTPAITSANTWFGLHFLINLICSACSLEFQ